MDYISEKDKDELRKRLQSSLLNSKRILNEKEIKREIEKERQRIDTEQMKVL